MNMKGKIQDSLHRELKFSYIEQIFYETAKSKIPSLEREIVFGDLLKKYRYRVDFLVRSKRVAIELDGRKSHSTEEQRQDDAKRQRYLEKSGYRVIRFTGKEINQNLEQCVQEVIEYLECLDVQYPPLRQIIYLDQLFLQKEISNILKFYREIYPEKNIQFPIFEKIILAIVTWLQLKGDIDVFIFKVEGLKYKTEDLHQTILEYDKGIIRFFTITTQSFIALEILEHLEYHAHLYDKFVLVADDPCYIDFLKAISSSDENIDRCRLVRLGNEETSLIDKGMNQIKWQDIRYMICTAIGLNLDEF